MPTLWVDIETYSDVDLRAAGVYAYSESPAFEILMAAFSLDGDSIRVAVGEEAVQDAIGDVLLDEDFTIVAHNAQFERICFSRFLSYGPGTYLDPARFRDTQAMAAEAGYPQSLKDLALALGASPKDEAGTRLINMFCKPKRVMPEDKPEDWEAFKAYCAQDVATLIEVDRELSPLTATELAVYIADQRINDRGVTVDRDMARAAVLAADDNRMLQELEISSLTGVANPGSQPQMLKCLQAAGLPINDLKAETISKCLEGNLPAELRRVLELRQELAGTASKKYQAALVSASSDGRLRGGFRFFGAHTGRWAGRGFQLHNLPRASLDSEAEVNASIMDLMLGLGADAFTLKALVRSLLVGPFTVVDYSAIEARVLAWLASEQWALKAFRDGRDIYTETAQRMGGGMTRWDGKIATLALGYNGGVNSLRAMGAEGSDGHLQEMVNTWRRASPSIVAMWDTMGESFRTGGPVGNHINVEHHFRDSRAIRLPSGRAIWYHGCRWDWVETPYGPRREASFRDPKNRARARTYGGRLIENVTQAVARDILAEALVRLEDHGYAVAAHVHDEAVLDAAPPVDEVVKIMCELPEWAAGLPVDAEGFTSDRYRKG